MDRDNNNYDVESWQQAQEIKQKELQEELQVHALRKEKKARKSYFFSGLAVGLASALLIVSLAYLFTRIQSYMSVKNQLNRAEADQGQPGQDNGQSSGQSASQSVSTDTILTVEMLRKIQTIEQMIKQSYYQDEDIDVVALEEGVYRGMIDSLGDIYSEYYTPEELTALMQQTEGVYYGIGAGVSQDTVTLYPKIVKVYSGTPSEEAGLRENDIIFEVEGESTYDMSITDVVAKIKGEEGTWVNLTIYREGESDYLSIDVQRRKVDIPTVEFEMLDNNMAYILIGEFDHITVDQFAEALAMARGNGMEGLILDVRSNPGGSLDAVVEVCGMLLPEGVIVYTEDKYGRKVEYTCKGDRELEVPLVVLINGNSASASEILAGAVKDYEIGTLVGTTTFGKGIVQSVMPLNDGSAVKLTISNYFTPKGNNIHGIGVEPHIECIFDGEAYYNEPGNPDNQLEKAKEVLLEMMSQK